MEGKLHARTIGTNGIEEICTLEEKRCSDRDVAIEKFACETSRSLARSPKVDRLTVDISAKETILGNLAMRSCSTNLYLKPQ